MRGVFDDKVFEKSKQRNDTELTLGTVTLLLIFFGIVIVCGLCFGLGYTVGHRGGQATLATGQQPASGPQSPLKGNGAQGNGPLPKPSATTQGAAPPVAAQSAPAESAAAPAPSIAGSNKESAQPAPSSQPEVRPALPPATGAAQTVSASSAQPAAPPAVPLMVQIAAVSHEEDADVLVGALRRHGYEVDARRDAADNLIHVRIGPFNDRNEANRWRNKLLNDGYNAMIQP